MKNQQGLQGARRLFFAQFVVVAVLVCCVWTFFDIHAARSMGLGGMVCLLPQLCFAHIVFSEQRASLSKIILRRLYRGEAMKLCLSAGLFALVFRWGDVMPAMFFMGYVLVQGLSWFAPLFFRKAVTKTGMKIA